jgi:ferredoxin
MPDMKVKVDFDLCESNAVCMGILPEVFEVRDDDFLYILDEHPPEALRPKLEECVASCPPRGHLDRGGLAVAGARVRIRP